jgi:hypothetical protein
MEKARIIAPNVKLVEERASSLTLTTNRGAPLSLRK